MENLIIHLYSTIRFFFRYMWGIIFIIVFMPSCTENNNRADAYGNFEAREIIVSAESSGKLLDFSVEEGEYMEQGKIAGIIDTTLLYVQKEQLLAQKDVVISKINQIKSQKEVQLAQLKNLKTGFDRVQKLYKDGAATSKQIDDISGQMDVARKQVNLLDVQFNAVLNEVKSVAKQVEMVDVKLGNCKIKNPVSGTLLEKYSEAGELVNTGRSLYKIASLKQLILRAYVDESMLTSFGIGDSVSVFVDFGKGNLKKYRGKVKWVSDKAEFTPKIVQTKDERVNLVYAVKINVKNDGSLKIGMPGEVKF